MFLSREIVTKLCQNYTKTYIYKILHKIRSIKQIIFNKYATNLKTTISHRSLRISDLLLLYFLNFYFAFLVDIIDNIITYGLYSPYYVTRTSTNGRAVYWSCDTDRDTWQRYCTTIGGSYGDVIRTICFSISRKQQLDFFQRCARSCKSSMPVLTIFCSVQ